MQLMNSNATVQDDVEDKENQQQFSNNSVKQCTQ